MLYNGNGDTVYDAIDLDGFATDENGFFVVGSANVPNVDLVAFTTLKFGTSNLARPSSRQVSRTT